jgi:Double zinc ribbon
MRCFKCGTDNPSDRAFCGDCGARFLLRCPTCGRENSLPFKFCGECGAPLASVAAADRILTTNGPELANVQAAVNARSDGERKTVTALFADIKGSTELMRDLDPEEARAVIDPVLQLMMDAVQHYDGYVVQ